jgi:catechol 2,3-dioxygenase-like lactoylglutathione lyase family enzyme
MSLRRIHHVAISMPSEARDAAVSFYGEVLGFEQLPVPDSLAHVPIITWFRIGKDELHLLEEPSATDGARRHICFEVDDIAPYRQRLDSAGIETEEGDPIPGRPRFFCYDPGGNRLEFLVDNTDAGEGANG